MVFLDKNAWFAGIVLACAGIPIGHWGKPWFNEISSLVAGLFLFQILIVSLNQSRKPESGFARWMLSGLGSFMVAYSLYRFRKFHVPMFFMGLFGGFFIGIFISLAFSSISGVSNFYIMAFMCGIFMTAVELKAYYMNAAKPSQRFLFKLWATSIMSSYLIMRGFSTVIGGYPSEIDLLSSWASEARGEKSEYKLPWTYYIYLVMQIVGIIVIYKHQRRIHDKDRKEI
jgi:hypothetical protein